MKRLLLALLLLVPTFGAATLPTTAFASEPWPDCLPCPPEPDPGTPPPSGGGGQ